MRLVRELPAESCFADVGSGDTYFAGRVAAYADRPVYAVDIGYRADEDLTVPGGEVRKRTAIEALPQAGVDCLLLMDVLDSEFVLPFAR